MSSQEHDDLVKRIAKLARVNQDLEEKIKKLVRQNEKMFQETEKHRSLLEKFSDSSKSGSADDRREHSARFNMVTVLFAEIHGISKFVMGNAGSADMDELDEIIYDFDQITTSRNVEKIKTIGDTYMCAGGIPVKNITNPVEVVLAALEMSKFIDNYEKRKRPDGEPLWSLKLGIHTGPVTSAISGKKKISYDIKGDTVNIASRVEAVSEKGKVLISVMTYELVKEFFDCDYYGKLPVKYKGDLQVYQVRGLKTEFCDDESCVVPNSAFNTKFGLIQFTDIQEMMLDKLEAELPEFLHYHNVKHTVDVVTEVELIGWAEGCSDEEILLLKTAGLFHDAGHTIAYDDHELHGTVMAREILPRYNYTREQIERICQLIMVTKLPPRPNDLLERIMCDSDLDYLGRSDFVPVSNTLFEELKAQNKISALNDWNKLQVKFISGHQYFTETARKLREVNKQAQIDRIQGLITSD